MSAALRQAVAELWPAATTALGRGGPRGGPQATARYWVVPAAGGVGAAVPTNPRAAARAVRRFSAATTPVGVASRVALSAALRVGAGRLLPGALAVAGPDTDALAGLLATVLGQPVTFAVAIGSERVNRKRVLEIFGPTGHSVAFAKVGGTPLQDADVEAEAAALQWWQGRRVRGVHLPEPLWSGQWRGARVLVMSALPQRPWPSARDRLGPPVREIGALVAATNAGEQVAAESPWFASVAARLSQVNASTTRRRALACWERLAAPAGTSIPFAAWHGDFTPWNMARHRQGLSVWDWERFAPQVPAGLDLLHHALTAVPPSALTPQRVLETLTRAPWHQLGPLVAADAGLARQLYLAEILARYLPLVEKPGGEVLGPRAEVVLAAWEMSTSARSGDR